MAPLRYLVGGALMRPWLRPNTKKNQGAMNGALRLSVGASLMRPWRIHAPLDLSRLTSFQQQIETDSEESAAGQDGP